MSNDFEHNLIKGRIAEMVFELMMRESGAFTVIPFGYENTIHELLHYQNIKKQKKAIQRVRKTPDFVVISSETKTVHLVEVKYRKNPDAKYLRKMAQEMMELWDPSWLFVASPKEFYFDSAEFIVKNNGKMKPLLETLEIKSITPKLRKKYLELLNNFEQ
ncbi:MAG: hypothetical protein Q8P37_00090 [Candidatus Spechtbacteria bacterium]|nr:hypothetical protein [Candidatus Spechtbacteria bacterium]